MGQKPINGRACKNLIRLAGNSNVQLQLAVSTGSGVDSFTPDPSLGNFILTRINIRIPKIKMNSVNEGTTRNWDEPIAKYVEKCKFHPG
ncbi:Fructose-1,6-bisphosphatase class 1/Sedoheputulose-1,7-bisphosphatase [Parasponia andersonii]|uniref:Fructose-1,6-bisphosphatase class 1/Sedoheputulose-1,7-bisphosphatase n=1 Tax=Parasponia andersonii TaxID=3476 RepID=A0A2P5D856_PARAD|nr:Fructose-1,6-bisphosphatase class 1/Sedoheputulose-1,7-bisphosphatase [Parasponia andersonii]